MKSFESTGLERDIDKVRSLSALVKKKILESNPKYERKIEKLSNEELEDFDKVLGLAEQVLIKYQQKTDTYHLLKEFADMIQNWSGSLVEINDEIQELIISAQSSVSDIKTAQGDVAASMSFGEPQKRPVTAANVGTINLTKSATPVYPQEYLQNPKAQYEQVI